VNFSLATVLWLVMLIPSITFHEFMHGYAAYLLGDPTAKNAGRLTLNPIASIDPIGTVLLPLLMFFTGGPIFGYAKPVPYNPMYFKNLRQGEITVGLAGPASNLALALVGAALAWIGNVVVVFSLPLASALWLTGSILALANLVLMFFNLIPIPPLDGSSVIPLFLPDSAMRSWYQLQRYSFVILIGILWLVPLIFHISPISTYFDFTVYPLLNLLLPRTALAVVGL
jgi:Zn-dependent protease